MDEPKEKATTEQILQFLTTEHFTLQTAKSATVAEANGRATLFLSSVSSAVVALAFIGQVSGIGTAFFIFGLVLFPSLLFLGFVTFERAIQTAIENMLLSRGINRIRHYYLETAPEVKKYFIQSANDDIDGALYNMGIVPNTSAWQHFVTNAGMISVINSILAGVFSGMITRFALSLDTYFCAGIGIIIFILSAYLHHVYQMRKYVNFESGMEILFPGKSNE